MAATPRTVLVWVALYLVSLVALQWSDAQLAGHTDLTKPDLQFGYGPPDVLAFLTALGPAGRTAYLLNLVIDTLMPVAFAGATILVVARAFPRWLPALALAPATFLVLDLVENTAFAIMLAQYPNVSEALIVATSPATSIKLAAFFVGLPTLVGGAIALGIGWLRRRG